MKRHTGAWKAFERRAAELFGGIRCAFSGACPQVTGTRSDVKHDRLYVECKHRKAHSLCTLMRQVREKARREYKTGIVVLAERGERGCIICLHSDDLEALSRPEDHSDLPLFQPENCPSEEQSVELPIHINDLGPIACPKGPATKTERGF